MSHISETATTLNNALAYIFPGQGSQVVGMGRDWAEAFDVARDTFHEADEALGFALSKLCFEGPEDQLQLTANTQPALLTTSVAMARALRSVCPDLQPAAMAGHSLGEYSAHVVAGSLDFGDALRLVRRRGELMQQAVPVGVGAMAAIIGLEAGPLSEVVAATTAESPDEVVTLANINSPKQIVIAGHTGAVERAMAAAKVAGAKLAKLLPVSAPFHSPLMVPARAGLTPDLCSATFRAPAVPVMINVDATLITEGDAARDGLERQIDGSVRWSESMLALRAMGVSSFLEIGPGKVLTGLGKRIDRSADWKTMPAPEDLSALCEALS